MRLPKREPNAVSSRTKILHLGYLCSWERFTIKEHKRPHRTPMGGCEEEDSEKGKHERLKQVLCGSGGDIGHSPSSEPNEPPITPKNTEVLNVVSVKPLQYATRLQQHH